MRIVWALETLFLEILAEYLLYWNSPLPIKQLFYDSPYTSHKYYTFWRAFCRHMWFEFVVGSLCSKRFFSGYSGFPRPTFPTSNFSLERTCLVFNTWSEGNQKVDCPFKLFVCLCFFIFWQIILLTRMTNERLRCITNIENFTDITNIPQQIMLVFVGNNFGYYYLDQNVF